MIKDKEGVCFFCCCWTGSEMGRESDSKYLEKIQPERPD